MRSLIRNSVPFLLTLVVSTLFLTWLSLTPDGLLGKLDAIGFAVCHQIPDRSYALAERTLPLCARCSGMYLGALVGLIYHFHHKRSVGLPVRSAWIPLAVLAFLFTLDGINSYLTFFTPGPLIYEPQNWLRLITGSGLGLGIAAVLVPSFNQATWMEVVRKPALDSWKPLAGLLVVCVLADLALITGSPLLVYLLSVLSGLTVVVILSLAYTMLWLLVTRRENTFTAWNQLRWHLLGGFGTTILQIGVIDALRFTLAGGWVGF